MAKRAKSDTTRRTGSHAPRTKKPRSAADRLRRSSQVAPPPDADGDASTLAAAEIIDDSRGDGEIVGEPSGKVAFTVVGVGASAGGLEAFKQMLHGLPPNTELSIVYVQHLSPNHESALAALLRESTPMPVLQVTDRMQLQPRKVYVIPPNAFLEIENGAFHLSARPDDRTRHMPIDAFFRSLAEYAQQRAVGVVLSGSDSDGSAGLREIKAVGGITYAQDPATAAFDGMPRSAVATGVVDMVLPPEQIAKDLVRVSAHPLLRHVKSRTIDQELSISQEQWNRIFALLRAASGVDFTHYKQPTLRRRLQRRMVLHKITTVELYLRHLQENPSEVRALYQDVLIHVTRFFREPESYDLLRTRVFPQMMRDRVGGGHPLRIWVPGCSTGEEAYSIAISLVEFMEDDTGSTPVQIFATDVSETAVEQARSGIYSASIAADVSPDRLRRFFTRIDGSYRISKTVRDAVIFARQDLTRDPPFSKLDLIVCRNVLIYLGPVLQKKLMNVFHYALRSTGFLVLGGSETIGPHADLFALADKRHKLYTKKMNGIRSAVDYSQDDLDPPPRERTRKPVAEVPGGTNIFNEANRMVLNRYAPPGVVVDDDLQIVQFRGQTGPFLEPAPGEASLNLLKMVRDGLLFNMRSALHEAKKTGESVRREGLRVKHQGQIIDVNIEVTPLAAQHQRHFLVLFENASPAPVAPAGRGKRAPAKGRKKGARDGQASEDKPDERTLRLQQELAASREYLQSIIQDLEAANEELQSANEEILSSNEELQSTNEELDTAKEELQSTNEELNTVNEELQARNEELSRVNSDVLNLLSSVQIAVVMVSADLRIRRFTPMAEKLLNLIPTDVGRPIGDIKPNIDIPELERLIVHTVDTVTVIERETRDRQGSTYLLRIRPYKNVENRIDGAVIALFDMEMGRPTTP
jgi:two-component system CheB/CheR fusion protein